MAARTLASSLLADRLLPGGPVVSAHTGTHSVITDASGRLWDEYRFTTTGAGQSITIERAGPALCLVVTGAQAGHPGGDDSGGPGGTVLWGEYTLPVGTHTVVVGANSAYAAAPGASSLGTFLWAGWGAYNPGGGSTNGNGAMGAGNGSTQGPGVVWVDGVEYGKGGARSAGSAPAANTGGGGKYQGAGSTGVVVVRIPR